jgi:4-hydroxybenzoate polyprenyltransferase
MASRLREYWLLTRMHRPIGTLLLLWPTLWALWIASDGQPRISDLLIFSLGTLLMRSAGCAINDYADRDFDRHVKRTADRPLTAGRIKPWEALAVFAFLSLVALSLIISYNKLTWLMAAIAAFLAVSYPFTKRFLSIPQAYLGIAFGFGIPMAFAATTNAAPPLCWVLLLANIFWAIAYDTEYAMVDRDDDIHLGIKTSAITFGRFDVEMVMLSYGITLALLALAGKMASLGLGWWLGLIAAGLIAIYHYGLIKHRSREGCFKAFNHNNWFGAAVFCGLPLDTFLSQWTM